MNLKHRIILFTVTALTLGAVIYFRSQPPESFPTEVKTEMKSITDQDETLKLPGTESLPAKETNTSTELIISMKELPVKQDLEVLSDEEIHHTPKAVLQGGMIIGELIEDAETHPEKQEMTLKFLKSCAENEDVLQAVRAVCWKKTLSKISDWKIFMPISDAEVPEEIKKLALKLP